MKKIVFALSVIVAIQLFLLLRPKEQDYSYYIQKIKSKQIKIDSLVSEVNKSNHEINRLKSEINKKDSVIDVADKSTFRELSNNFLRRVK